MAGKKKEVARFDVQFHVFMSHGMKQAIKDRAKRDNIPESQVMRQLIADELGLSQEHVKGHFDRAFDDNPVNERATPSPHAGKKLFSDNPHPLDVAWRPIQIEKDVNDD